MATPLIHDGPGGSAALGVIDADGPLFTPPETPKPKEPAPATPEEVKEPEPEPKSPAVTGGEVLQASPAPEKADEKPLFEWELPDGKKFAPRSVEEIAKVGRDTLNLIKAEHGRQKAETQRLLSLRKTAEKEPPTAPKHSPAPSKDEDGPSSFDVTAFLKTYDWDGVYKPLEKEHGTAAATFALLRAFGTALTDAVRKENQEAIKPFQNERNAREAAQHVSTLFQQASDLKSDDGELLFPELQTSDQDVADEIVAIWTELPESLQLSGHDGIEVALARYRNRHPSKAAPTAPPPVRMTPKVETLDGSGTPRPSPHPHGPVSAKQMIREANANRVRTDTLGDLGLIER